MCFICRNEDTPGGITNVCSKSNLEQGSSEDKNSTRETQPLPNADNGELHVNGGKNSSRDTQLLLDADKGACDIGGEKNSSRETQPPSRADKRALHLDGEKNVVSGHRKRHQPEIPQTLNESKRARNCNGGMEDVLKHVAVAVSSLTKKAKKEDAFSIDNVISVLQAIPDMDDDLILDACDFLEDERRARMFLALDTNLRKKWLMRKLRPV